jgi:DNA-binding protein YbaB
VKIQDVYCAMKRIENVQQELKQAESELRATHIVCVEGEFSDEEVRRAIKVKQECLDAAKEKWNDLLEEEL